MKSDLLCPRGWNLNFDIFPSITEGKEANILGNNQMIRIRRMKPHNETLYLR